MSYSLSRVVLSCGICYLLYEVHWVQSSNLKDVSVVWERRMIEDDSLGYLVEYLEGMELLGL